MMANEGDSLCHVVLSSIGFNTASGTVSQPKPEKREERLDRVAVIGAMDYVANMSPEELHVLRRRLRLTQAQFAECLGISKHLIESIELGRRRLTEGLQRDIAQVFGVRIAVHEAGSTTLAPLRQGVFLQGKFPAATGMRGSGHHPGHDVRPEPAQPVPARAGPIIEFYHCEVLGCPYETAEDMRYCAQHMALAMIEGRPTRRVNPSMTGPLHADFVRQHNARGQRGS
jgi:transcriptional regulator with XRE-family HTH domain